MVLWSRSLGLPSRVIRAFRCTSPVRPPALPPGHTLCAVDAIRLSPDLARCSVAEAPTLAMVSSCEERGAI